MFKNLKLYILLEYGIVLSSNTNYPHPRQKIYSQTMLHIKDTKIDHFGDIHTNKHYKKFKKLRNQKNKQEEQQEEQTQQVEHFSLLVKCSFQLQTEF